MEGEHFLENNVVGQKHDGLQTLTECFHILNLSITVKFFLFFDRSQHFFIFFACFEILHQKNQQN